MKLDILAIAAHPDDIEVAAGGTLISHAAQGKNIGIIDLTKAELSTRGTVEQRTTEAYSAAKLIGAKVREQLDLKDGFFQLDEEAILKVVRIIRKFQPEIIITNAIEDRHPDHQRAAELVARASFMANLIKIKTEENGLVQSPWRTRLVLNALQDKNCNADIVVDFSPFIEQKFNAIREYKSQFYQPDCQEPETPISCPSFFESLKGRNAMWGRQIGVEYAEAFSVGRAIGVSNLFVLY